MSRWKAALVHLGISIAIGLVVAALLLFVWYPPPYFGAGGADKLVMLLVGIDLALGPLLTLSVFKSGKRGLKFDLAVIGVLQLAALVYGLSIICQSRPVFLVGAIDRFNLVAANAFEDKDLAEASKPEFGKLSWTGPKLVAVQPPTGRDEKFDLMVSGSVGHDIEVKPKFYVDYATQAAVLAARAKPLDVLRAHIDAAGNATLDQALRSLGGRKEADLVWLPIVARKTDLVMLMDKQTGNPLKAVALTPW